MGGFFCANGCANGDGESGSASVNGDGESGSAVGEVCNI